MPLKPKTVAVAEPAKPDLPPAWGLVHTVLVLVAALALLLWRAWLPSHALASNDGPLGAISARWCRDSLFYAWNDLNALGFANPCGAPDLTFLCLLLMSPLAIAKFYATVAVLFPGLCAWVCFRQWKLSPPACLVGALAVTLNSDFFSVACWGVGPQAIAVGFDFLAVAALGDLTGKDRWARLALAGTATGLGVCEAFDIGALFSLFVGSFAIYQACQTGEKSVRGLPAIGQGQFMKGAGTASSPLPIPTGCQEAGTKPSPRLARRFPELALAIGAQVAVLVVCAGITATSVLYTLIGTQVKGIAGMAQDSKAKSERWDQATQWSLPKIETLGLLSPGLFGFRMETPKGMAFGAEWFRDGEYWGGVGREAAVVEYLDTGGLVGQANGLMRFTGGGIYAGVFVLLVAAWGLAQALRGRNSVFTQTQRGQVFFWAAAAVLALLLAYGRYGQIYRPFYALPYMSTIRNPAKFIHICSWAITILFALGLDGLARLAPLPAGPGAPTDESKTGSKGSSPFDKAWRGAMLLGLWIAALLAWIYAREHHRLVEWLQKTGFSTEANDIASFSISQAFFTVILLAVSGAVLLAVINGCLAKRGQAVQWLIIAAVVGIDLWVANLPWVIVYNWKSDYQVPPFASNPVIDFLKKDGYNSRVTLFPLDRFPNVPNPAMQSYVPLAQQYQMEWVQKLFPYNDIPCLEVVQLPRPPTDYLDFEQVLGGVPFRHWALTSTKYVVGLVVLPQMLGQSPEARLLRPARTAQGQEMRFSLAYKEGITNFQTLEDLTATLDPAGGYEVFELEGVLPRVAVFDQWEVIANPPAALARLASPEYNPRAKVVLDQDPGVSSPPTGKGVTRAQVISYQPMRINIRAQADGPTVVMLNNKFNDGWHARVDGKSAKLMRCNFLAQGVLVPKGEHEVEFEYSTSKIPLLVSCAAVAGALYILAWLRFGPKRKAGLPTAEPTPTAAAAPA